MTKLESYQKNENGIQFIKSYPVLNRLKITPTQKSFIELVLSYQDNGNAFTMKYQTVADILAIDYQTVKDLVRKLKNLGIFTTETKKNYNGTAGGSSTKLQIDYDVLFSLLDASKKTDPIPAPEPETPTIESEPAEPVLTGEFEKMLARKATQEVQEAFIIDDDTDVSEEQDETKETYFDLDNGTKVIVPADYLDRWHLVSDDFKRECATNKNQVFFELYLSNEENEINNLAPAK